MKIDDICSPGHVPNAHRLRQETIRAIAFCENLKSSEKAVELQGYFREAIAYLDREIVSKDLPESEKPTVDPSAQSPFEDDELPDAVFPVKAQFVPINKRGKKA